MSSSLCAKKQKTKYKFNVLFSFTINVRKFHKASFYHATSFKNEEKLEPGSSLGVNFGDNFAFIAEVNL